MRTGAILGGLCCAACLSLVWQVWLWHTPTDTLVGNGRFAQGGYLLQTVAAPDSVWVENGQSLYRAVLRVDARDVRDWLHQPVPSAWQLGTSHQYLVERRDGGGKRVITITLQKPTQLLPAALWAWLPALSYTVLLLWLVRSPPVASLWLPLLLSACSSWLSIAWHGFGIPFSYVALQVPLWGQWCSYALAQTLLLGAMVQLALYFPQPLFKRQTWVMGVYALFPLGCVAIWITPLSAEFQWAALWQWEQQITICLKALTYLLWAIQYRRAKVRQRGQLHWWLLGITAYDLVFLVRLFTALDLTVLQLILAALVPVGYGLALLSEQPWRWRLDGTSGLVHGITNTLTLALFLCGVGLTAIVFFNQDNQAALPLVTLALALGFALTTVPLANLLREQFDSWFQGTRSAQRALLHEFTARVSAQLTLSEVVQAFEEALEQGVRPSGKTLWLWNAEAQALQKWGATTEFIQLPPTSLARLSQLNGFTRVAHLPEWAALQPVHGLMPLVASGELVGVCGLLPRIDGREYSDDGLRFLETLARPATLALRNAQLVEQLEDKVIALRQAYQQLITAQELERSRLATELHDETLQQLAHVNLLAGSLRYQLPDEPQLKELQQVLGATERGLRDILRGVHPAVLTNLGLLPALRSWLPQSAHVQIQLHADGFQQRLPDAMLELTLYRLCQESVNNALKHAQAHQIEVRLIWQNATVVLEIQDDGIGFEPSHFAAKQRAAQGHFGLTNLRERVNALHGQLTIHSQPQRGTLIRAVLPVPTKG